MISTIKYLGLGLLIGMAGTSLIVIAALLSGVSAPILLATFTALPSQTSLPATASATLSPSPTSVLTYTPIPSFTEAASPTIIHEPSITATLDAVQSAINAGELIYTGPLSISQQEALYQASLTYVEPTVADSLRLAKQINSVGYGDPSNICGPLAIAILRDAGLVSAEIKPHDYWLLNPLASGDQAVLMRTFPIDRYLYIKSPTPLNKVDWHTFPLEPGDFLFIWHGSGGNFDHMLAVSRVDSSMRAYTVTNYATPAGFVIAETLLYDPNDPSAGIFHMWTKDKNAILG